MIDKYAHKHLINKPFKTYRHKSSNNTMTCIRLFACRLGVQMCMCGECICIHDKRGIFRANIFELITSVYSVKLLVQ